MNESLIFLTVHILAHLGILVAVVWCLFRLKDYRRMVQLMTADTPVVPTDPELIEEWVKKRDSLPKDSPKHIAYTNRLIEVGRLKAD